MSVRWLTWAFEQKVEPTTKVVLLALADQANDQGKCWPSIKTVAAKASVSVRTAQRTIREQESAGRVRVASRSRPDGKGNTSNMYTLIMAPLPKCHPLTPAKLSPPPHCQDVNAPVTHATGAGVTQVSPQEPSYRSITEAEAEAPNAGASAPASAAAAKKKVRRQRKSGIVTWLHDDADEAEMIEANEPETEVQAAVAALVTRGKDPVPGLVGREIQQARAGRVAAERAKARGTGCSPTVPVSATRDLRNELAYIEQMHRYRKFSDEERDQHIAAARAKFARPV